MRKRILSLLTALALCLGLLPVTAGAAGLPSSFYVSIGGTRLTAGSNLNDVLGDGTVSVSYEESGGKPKWTINLNNAHLTDSIYVGEGIVDVVLTGENSITTHDLQGGTAREGIAVNSGSISLTGSGSLTIDVTDTGTTYPADAITAHSSGPMSGDIKIEGISDLVLKGNAQAISTSGAVSIIDSSITASNIYTFGSNQVIGGKSVRISGSEINVTGAENCYGISSSPGYIEILNSTVEVDSSNIAVYARGQLQISNSIVTAVSSAASGLYAENQGDGAISIEFNSVVTATTGVDWPGIYTPGGLTISDSEVTAHSPASNAIYTGYGISITDSTLTATAEGSYPAVYTDDLIQISGSTVEASAARGPGVFSAAEMTIEGDSNVTATGYGPGLISNGGLTVSGGTVDAVSTDYSGFESGHSLTIQGGTFHAKGGTGCPAVRITTTEDKEYIDTVSRDTSRIELASGLGEISGGVAAVSDWYDVEDGYCRFFTSFVAPGTETLEAEGANALNEVTILAGHTVTFETQDGAAAKIRLVADGEPASKPADPTRDGYDFGGWYTDEGCTTAYDFTAAVTEDITLYAKWTPKPVTPPTPPPVTPPDPEPAPGPSGPSGGGSSGWEEDDDDDDGDVPPAPAKKVSVKNPDGSTTITDRETGTVTTVTTAPDGTTVTVVTDSGGRVISAEASVPKGTAVLPAGPGLGTEMKITVKGGGSSRVTIPLANAAPGVVAVLAGERVDRKSAVTADGVALTVRGSAAVRLEDRGRSFPDVPQGWKAEAAAFVSARGILNGGTDGRFRPDAPMTRAMLAAALYNLEGNPAPAGTGGFSDVPHGMWCADAVAWAAAEGIVGGYGGGVFRPGAPITREQLAVMLWRYAGCPAPGPDAALDFPDADAVGEYARQALLWAVEKGILSGYGDGRLDPKGAATRIQAARMIMNFMAM